MLDARFFDTFGERVSIATPARIEQMFEAAWNSVRRLNELCNAEHPGGPNTRGPAEKQRIVSEMAIAEAQFRQLTQAMEDARNGPHCHIISTERTSELEKALGHLAERVRSIGVPWPRL